MHKNQSNATESKVIKRAFREKHENAIKLLMRDHMQVQKIFGDFEKLKEKNEDQEKKVALIRTACEELMIHMIVEEEVLYPLAAEALDNPGLITESKMEHAATKQLIKELESLDADEDLYDAKVLALSKHINHHIEKEEREMFFQMKRTDLDLLAIGDEIRSKREQIRATRVKRRGPRTKKH